MPENRTGRLDLLIKEGLGLAADRLGIRAHMQPVIDRFVDQTVTKERIPITPEEIAEKIGLLNPGPDSRFRKGKR